MPIKTFLLTHKLLLVFVAATTAFGISTIVLAVNNAKLSSDDELEVITTVPPVTTTEPPIDMSKYRLPTTAVPTSYDLYLYPNLSDGLFKGQITAVTKIQLDTAEIVMNTNKLKITRVTVDQVDASFNVDEEYERLMIKKTNGDSFGVSTVDVTVHFDGDMNNRIVGLYRSSYNYDGTPRYMATSKFEPTYARQAYPCFDEPNMKATYKIHLLKPDDSSYVALSNYPQTSEEKTEDGIMVHFGETVPMSTYLSCFIVSDFIYTNTSFDNNGEDVPFRVYSSPQQLDKTTYAGTVGKSVIEYYIKYFAIPYPLPKLDLVAIPDFVSGAMEHWGLVTFRETALLYTDSTHSSANKQRVATVVAHELAHSWFGNLVTMDWWNDLWLNEGFASYIEYKGVDYVEPSWGMMDQFLTSDLHPVLSLDATQGSHPIIQTVVTPDQITEVFDTISYNKGAAVLRMLENVVGTDNFQKGVTNYLNKYRYKNAVTQYLWDEIQEVVGNAINITEFMNTFTIQMGYPILTTAVDGNKYIFTQRRFLKDPDSASKGKSSPLDYKWSVPITYVTNLGKSSEIVWFHSNLESISINKPDGANWIKFNADQVGYYRVNYPEVEWRKLIAIVLDLSISDRTHLIEESFGLAESGDLSYTVPLDLTKYLTKEFDYVPWSVASSMLQHIGNYLENSQYESAYQKYVTSILKPAYEEYTWNESPEDGHLKRLSRVVVLTLACAMRDKAALTEAKAKFDKWILTKEPLSQDLRSIIYKYGTVNADEATWTDLLQIFSNEDDANEKLKLMNGLASVQNPTLLTRLIELGKNETYVRGQDYFTLLQYIAANPIGSPLVWDYVREHWLDLVERFTLNDRYLGRLIPGITGKFSTSVKLDEMNSFFAKHPEAGAGAAARKQALETVNNNIKWLAKYKETVEEWIVQNQNL